MSRAPVSRAPVRGPLIIAVVVAVALGLALGACGKRGSPRAPAGDAGDYAYPAVYPYPKTTLRDRDTVIEDDSEAAVGGEENLTDEVYDRTTTKTYGTD